MNNGSVSSQPAQNKAIPEKARVAVLTSLEHFDVKGFCIAPDVLLAVYAAAKFTGLSCDSGYSGTSIATVADGHLLPSPVKRTNIGGNQVEEEFIKRLTGSGIITFDTAAKDLGIPKNMKEKVCYVAMDCDEERNHIKDESYEMPDGTVLTIKEQTFMAPEVIFNPARCGSNEDGMGVACAKSIKESQLEITKELCENIILSGGNTMLKGLPERLSYELKHAPSLKTIRSFIKIIQTPDRKYAAWVGGSILSSISTFDKQWITRAEYQESGAENVVQKKCI